MEPSWADVSIAGIDTRLFCQETWIVKSLENRYKAFPGFRGPRIRVDIKLSDSKGTGLQLDEHIFFSDRGIYFGTSSDVGSYDYYENKGTLVVQPDHVEAQIDYYLRAVYSLLAFLNGGVMLHAAGILSGERAYLFMGASGSGKTTVSRVSTDKIILNDDLLILLPSSDGWIAYATPFWNPTQVKPSNNHASVAGIYKLVQAPMVECSPMELATALAEVLACVPLLTTTAIFSDQIMQRCLKIVTDIPVYWLRFLPDASFWKVI